MPPIGRVASLFSVSWMRSYSSSISGVTEARVSPSAASKSAMVTLRRVEPAAKRGQAGAAHQIFEVGAGEALGPLGERFEVDVVGERHVFGVDREDPPAPGGVRHADVDQLVEAARAEAAPGRSGSAGWSRRSRRHFELFEPVHLGEDGVDHPLGDLRLAEPAAARRAPGCRARR